MRDILRFSVIAALLLLPVRVDAAWARVTGATLAGTFSGAGSSHSFGALGAAVSVNQRIICIEHVESSSADATFPGVGTAPTDTLGNTYTKDLSLTYGNATNKEDESVWSAVVTSAGTPTITANRTDPTPSSHDIALVCGAYAGLLTTAGAAAAVDISKQVGDTGLVSTSTLDSGTTVATTSAANELKIGFGMTPGDNETHSPGTLDTAYSTVAKIDNNGSGEVLLEDADSGASGSTARATVGISPADSDFWGAAVVVYKLAPSGASCTPTLSLMGVGRCG